MSKFTTESGDTINYKVTEVKVTPTYSVEIDTEFLKDTITVRAEKENLEEAIEYALEGKNTMFRTKNKKAKAEKEEAEAIEKSEKENNSKKK